MIPLVVVLSGLSAGADARIAIAGDLAVTAAGRKVVVHSSFAEPRSFTIPCDAKDLVARPGFGDAEWAVLCSDRIVWRHRDETSEIPLDHANPSAFHVAFDHGELAVGYVDGTVELYTTTSAPPRVAHYGKGIAAVDIDGNANVLAATEDAVTSAPIAPNTLVVNGDFARFEPSPSTHARRRIVTGRSLWLEGDVADIDVANERVCVTSGDTFTCFAPGAPAEDAVDRLPAKLPVLPALELQAPLLDVTAAPVGAALFGGTLGVAALAGAPVLLGAFGSNLAQAVAVASMLALGGAGIAVGVIAGLFGIGTLIAALSSPGHVRSDGSCVGDLASIIGDTVNACVSVLGVVVGAVLLTTSVALVGGGVAAVALAPVVDRALGDDVFEPVALPALAGAAIGGGLGGLGALFVLDSGGNEVSDDQRVLDATADDIAAAALLLGGAALGGAIAYGPTKGFGRPIP